MSEHNLDVDARLFRIVHAFRGREDTRYYLKGVRIEPSPEGGVVMVATCGHTLLAVHDRTGRIARPATIQLPKHVRHAMRWRPAMRLRMTLADQPTDVPASIVQIVWEAKEDREESSFLRALAPNAEIDCGTSYPLWRKVVPGLESRALELSAFAAPTFAGLYIRRFAKAAARLGWHFHEGRARAHIALACQDAGTPAIVRFPEKVPAFGVIMPIGPSHSILAGASLPTWARSEAATPAEAATAEAAS